MRDVIMGRLPGGQWLPEGQIIAFRDEQGAWLVSPAKPGSAIRLVGPILADLMAKIREKRDLPETSYVVSDDGSRVTIKEGYSHLDVTVPKELAALLSPSKAHEAPAPEQAVAVTNPIMAEPASTMAVVEAASAGAEGIVT